MAFHPFIRFLSVVYNRTMSDDLRDLMLSRWQQVRDGLRETANKFSDAELSFGPADGAYTVAERLLHIAHEEEIEVHYGITRALPDVPPAYDVARFADRASILDALAGVHNRTLVYLHDLSDAELLSNIETPWGQKPQQAGMLMHVIEHEVHHRGELSLMLGLLGRHGLDA
jgi:uncharacterized damage-inducible protein DinB